MKKTITPKEGRTWPGYILWGRVRTSTVALIVAFMATWWLYETYQPAPTPDQVPASNVVPPGFIPDPAYTWVPRTEVQRTPEVTPTETTPTTTETTPTTPTTPVDGDTATDTPTSPAPNGPAPTSPAPGPTTPAPPATTTAAPPSGPPTTTPNPTGPPSPRPSAPAPAPPSPTP